MMDHSNHFEPLPQENEALRAEPMQDAAAEQEAAQEQAPMDNPADTSAGTSVESHECPQNTDNNADPCATCPHRAKHIPEKPIPMPRPVRKLMRLTDAVLPLVGMLCLALGYTTRTRNFFFMYYLLQLCSLGCVDAFRNANARELSVKRLEKRFGGAFTQLIFGIAVVFVGVHCLDLANIKSRGFIALVGAAGLKIFEQLFEEYLYASKRNSDASLLGLISSMLLGCGLILDASSMPVYFDGFYTLCTAGIGAIVGFFIAGMIVRLPRISLVPRNLGFAPRAMVQVLLYPAVAAAMVHFWNVPLMAALLGLIPWRLARTVCRRTASESRPLNLLVIGFSAASLLVMLLISIFPPYDAYLPYAACCFAAMLCVEIVFCAPSFRLYLATAMIAVAGVILYLFPVVSDLYFLTPVIAAVLCAGSILLNLRHAFLQPGR